MSAIDKLTPGGYTPASAIKELRAERDALRQLLGAVWTIARPVVERHTLGGESLVRRVDALLNGVQAPEVSDIFRICDAYESGFGHGFKDDRLPNPYGPPEEREAYDIGYRTGRDRREHATQGNRQGIRL